MSRTRLELHTELGNVTGYTNLYYQPPESLKMSYPCIRYKDAEPWVAKADNRTYHIRRCYDLILISKTPAMDTVELLLNNFETISVNPMYVSDNLYHYPLKLYY